MHPFMQEDNRGAAERLSFAHAACRELAVNYADQESRTAKGVSAVRELASAILEQAGSEGDGSDEAMRLLCVIDGMEASLPSTTQNP